MLSDIEVCYKMFTSEVLKELQLTSDGFGIEIEISAQIALARRWRIYEVSISYYGRTYQEGKKINRRDGLKALFYLLRFRICQAMKIPTLLDRKPFRAGGTPCEYSAGVHIVRARDCAMCTVMVGGSAVAGVSTSHAGRTSGKGR
jgi:hypothetical protein